MQIFRTAIFEKQGFDNIKIKDDVQSPNVLDYDVSIKVIVAGVNSIDHYVISGYRTIQQQKEKNQLPKQKVPQTTELPVNPLSDIPGEEFVGVVVEKVGSQVRTMKKGDKVAICTRVFDNTCDMCIGGNEMLCRNDGIMSVVNNGGFSDYIQFLKDMYLKFQTILIGI